MAWRGEDQLPHQREWRRDEPFAVDRHADQRLPAMRKALKAPKKPGFSTAIGRSNLGERACPEYRQRILCAQRDQDLVGLGHDAARSSSSPLAQLFDQIGAVAFDRIPGPVRDVLAPKREAGTLAPIVHREEVGIDLIVDEGIGIALPVQRIVEGNER